MNLLRVFLFIFLISSVSASEEHKYSFEKSEALKPLIEWRDYGPDAFSEALSANKPIFLLLTAPSWCYWCQVYESEDFLFHPSVVSYINANTIPIYVDADQRQDLTRQYLEGGWPSTTVMTPGRERLYGFSGPRPPSEMITNLGSAVDHVARGTFNPSVEYVYEATPVSVPDSGAFGRLVESYAGYTLQIFDQEHGGFGSGQKFPQGRTLDFALDLYDQTQNEQWLALVEHTLANQYTSVDELSTNYNLFDPVEGGFHRYGVERDWTPPHFEKMLYDNARLLKTYYHLSLVSDSPYVEEVVTKTVDYMTDQWYDSENGGFFGNTDVFGEDAYYGTVERAGGPARVEPAKYSNWNGDAIITFLYMGSVSGDITYTAMARKSLDFFATHMISDEGAYHYYKEGERGVTGSLVDNAYLLLAFTEAYRYLEENRYLETAIELADYTLDQLYDWNSSGFFERHSTEYSLYAPGEHIILDKPIAENGIMAYSLLQLYEFTDNPIYLSAGLRTLSRDITSVPGLDRGYYHVMASSLVADRNLVGEYNTHLESYEKEEAKRIKKFWLNDILASEFKLEEQKFEGSLLVFILVAFLAGLLSFLSPCSLPILPAYVAYSFRSSKKNIKMMTLMFFLGLSLVFTLLGMSATLIGSYLRSSIVMFQQIAGLFLLVFGVYILLGGGFKGASVKKEKPTTYLGSFFFGSALGISWTPCTGPILVSILILAGSTGKFILGGFLLFIYAIGLGLPLILLSKYLEHIKGGRIWKILNGRIVHIPFFGKKLVSHSTALISGLLFIILGYLIFSGGLFTLNQYVASTSFQKMLYSLEDVLLRWVL